MSSTPPTGNLTMYPLQIEHLTKRYGHDVVLDDLTFTVAPARVTSQYVRPSFINTSGHRSCYRARSSGGQRLS